LLPPLFVAASCPVAGALPEALPGALLGALLCPLAGVRLGVLPFAGAGQLLSAAGPGGAAALLG
jgi:hypothetical protein